MSGGATGRPAEAGAGNTWAPAKARPDESLIRALARAHRWKRMLEAEKCRSTAEIAEAEKIGRSFVNRLLRLTLLAPDIQEAILEGRHHAGGPGFGRGLPPHRDRDPAAAKANCLRR